MRNLLVVVAAFVAAGCSDPALPNPTSPAPTAPSVTEAVDVDGLLDDPCAAVSADLARSLRVPAEGTRFSQTDGAACEWAVVGAGGPRLVLAVIPAADPMATYFGQPGADVVDVRGFPAVIRPGERAAYCQFNVKTAPAAGFTVGYGAANGEVERPCDGVLAVAEQVAAKAREG